MHKEIKLLVLAIILIGISSLWLLNRGMDSPINSPMQASKSASLLPWPLEKSDERQKLLKFGMYVTPDPATNPISPPERFTGYHTGLDIEILPEEKESSVPVKTICEGKILFTGTIEGYGGVVIQECNINNQLSSVLYGHLKPSSIAVSQNNETIKPSSAIAELGDDRTEETGNTRKHLHLGIHKGNHIEFLGYVTDEKDLQDFIDPLPLLQD
ncbi:TPA: hypothetical protein DCG61_02235 [Patescibacteria group bacterium]|jgi:hypothetical protein|nr:hypothetical protein [Patescibacteria group bacterium]